MSYRESDVRDSLAAQLEFIEDGLRLLDTEVPLANAVGTRGFVDILARDRFGNLVVIEVKRSDQTAREALQEVLKYAELLRREHGHPEHRIRLVIASTSWRELTAPFSALQRFCPYPLLGTRIEVDEETGQVVRSSAVRGLPPSMRGQISENQVMLLWKTSAERDKAWRQIEPLLPALGMKDFLGAEVDFAGDDERVTYPFGLALVPGAIAEDDARAVGLLGEAEIAPGIGPEEIAEGLSAEDGPSVESEAMARLMEDIVELSEDAEALSPEGWIRLEQRGWVLRQLHRTGTFAAAKYIEDQELAIQIGGREGMNRTLMEVDVTPGLKPPWEEALLRAQIVLEGNSVWQRGLEGWLTEREAEEPRDYHLRIYNLNDIIRALLGLAFFGDGRWVDTLKVISGSEDEPDRALVGLIVWGGGGSPPLDAVKKTLPGGLDAAGFDLAMGGDLLQSKLMEEMDLGYALFERSETDEVSWRYDVDASRRPASKEELSSLSKFLSHHGASLRELKTAIDATSLGYFS